MIPVELVAHGADLEPRGQFEIVPASGSSSPLASLCPAVGVGATDTAGAAGPVHDPLAGWSGGCRGRLLSPTVTDGEDAVAHARQGRGTILLVDFPGGLFKRFGPVFPLGRLRMLLHGTYACSTTGAESSRRVTITRVSGPMASAQDSNRSLVQGDFMFLWFPRRAFPARSSIGRRRHEDENGRRPRMPSSYVYFVTTPHRTALFDHKQLSTLAFLHWQGPDGSAGSKAAASVVPRPRYRSCLESRPGVACRRLSHMTRSPM